MDTNTRGAAALVILMALAPWACGGASSAADGATGTPGNGPDGTALDVEEPSGGSGGNGTGGDGVSGSGGESGKADTAIDPCAGVACTRPPAGQCTGNVLRTFASVGTCRNGACSYGSTDRMCTLGCQNGACTTGDPALDDPNRPSLPFECPGDPLNAAQITEHVATGDETLPLGADKNWNGTEIIVRTHRVARTCQTLTGCSPWQLDPLSIYNEDYGLFAWVTADGTVMLVQSDVIEGTTTASHVQAQVTAGNFQVALEKGLNRGPARRYKARFTRVASPSDGNLGCFSLASKVEVSPTQTDGSHVEAFQLGKVAFPAPVPRTIPAPLAAWDKQCAGTPASNTIIASWFAPGSARLKALSTQPPQRSVTQTCHPITGCTPWADESGRVFRLFGLTTQPSGFALWLDQNMVVPIVDGLVMTGAFTGSVTTDRCVWFDETVVQKRTASAVITTTHFQEQNNL